MLAALTLRAGTDAAVELRWSASRSTAVKAPCEHDAKTSYTHARAGSRSAAENLTIVANRLLAVALAMTRCGDIFELSTCVEKK